MAPPINHKDIDVQKDEHKRYTHYNWKKEVLRDQTKMGYWEWVRMKLAEELNLKNRLTEWQNKRGL